LPNVEYNNNIYFSINDHFHKSTESQYHDIEGVHIIPCDCDLEVAEGPKSISGKIPSIEKKTLKYPQIAFLQIPPAPEICRNGGRDPPFSPPPPAQPDLFP